MREHGNEHAVTQVKSTCYMCYNACGIIAYTQDNKVLRIEGDPDNPQNNGNMCAKGRAGLYELDNPKRVTTPLRRRNPEKGIGVDPMWEPISWEEALTTVADKMVAVRNDDPRKLVGCAFDSHVYNQFFTWLDAFGTPNGVTGGADFFCGNGLHPVTELTTGSWFVEPDMDHCNYLILDGTQSGFVVNHLPMLMADKMDKARKRGMKLVVIDPICTNAGQAADEWIPIKPGTDASFALSMANVLVNELEIYDAKFIKHHTNGPYLIGEDGQYVRDASSNKPIVWDEAVGRAIPFDSAHPETLALTGNCKVEGKACTPSFQKVKEHFANYPPEEAAEITGIPAKTIRRIAKEFGEAASIGSTIDIDGHTLPLRPACINWYKGPISHSHGFMTGFSIQLLNMIIGGIDVPGGHLGSNPVGPWWGPSVCSDGMIIPNQHMLGNTGMHPYPARPVTTPESIACLELFPIAPYSGSMLYEGLLNPEKYKIPYAAEILLLCRSNPLMTTINPEVVAEALKKVPFIVSFAFRIDESAEFADIVFPDAHYLERYDAFTNAPFNFHAAGQGDWHFNIRQPVVEPPTGVTHWMQTLFDLAERVGFKAEFYTGLNYFLPLKDEFSLDPENTYTWIDVTDLWLKSYFGEERGLEWFKEHGFINYRKKTIQEAYPRPFLSSRMPIYIEHLVSLKEEVKAVIDEMGIPWDVSDYQPIPDWRPCQAHDHDGENSGFDLIAVSCKVPFHTFSTTVGNPILDDIHNAPHMKFGANVLMNSVTAQEKGLLDGEEVWIETTNGIRVKSIMKVTKGIHPEVVGFPGLYGRWARNLPKKAHVGPHFNTLLPHSLDRIDKVAGTTDMCIKAKVYSVSTP